MYNLLAKQKYTFRHIANIETHSADLARMIEILRSKKQPENENATFKVRKARTSPLPFGDKKYVN